MNSQPEKSVPPTLRAGSRRRHKGWPVWVLLLFVLPATAQKNIEDLPIDDALPTPAPTAAHHPTTSPPHHPATSHTHPTEEHFQAEHSEPKFPAPDGHVVGWFDLWHTFQIDFMRQSLYAGLLVALICSFLGVYVVLKRIVFVGVALAELSSAGIAVVLYLNSVAFFLLRGWHISPIWGGLLLMLLGVAIFAVRWPTRRVTTESMIGIVYSIAGATAILCIAYAPGGETHMLKLLQGDVLTVQPRETLEMLGIFAGVALIHVLFGKEFLLVSFDRDAAATLGYNAARWDFLLYLTIGVVIAFSIRATGVLVATTMLILPAVTALLLANRMRHVWPLAMLFSVVPVVFGLHLSLLQEKLPASAVIVMLSFLILLPVLAFSVSRRG